MKPSARVLQKFRWLSPVIEDHVIQVPHHAGGGPHWLYIETEIQGYEQGALINRRLFLRAHYLHGPARKDSHRSLVTSMGGSVQSHDPQGGSCKITGGTMEVGRSLRGHGIGTYLQNLTVGWIKSFHRNFSVERILLATVHAETQKEADRRNGFYKQFGVRFLWSTPSGPVEHAAGYSDPALMSDDLHVMPRGANPRFDAISRMTPQEALHRMGADLTEQVKDIAELERRLQHVTKHNQQMSFELDKRRKWIVRLGTLVAALATVIYLLVR